MLIAAISISRTVVQGIGRLSLVLQQFALASGAVGILTFLNAATKHPPIVKFAAALCIGTTGEPPLCSWHLRRDDILRLSRPCSTQQAHRTPSAETVCMPATAAADVHLSECSLL